MHVHSTYIHVIIYIQHTQTSFTYDILPDNSKERKLINLTSNKQLNTIILILLLLLRSQFYNQYLLVIKTEIALKPTMNQATLLLVTVAYNTSSLIFNVKLATLLSIARQMSQVLHHEISKEETATYNCYKQQCCLVYGGFKNSIKTNHRLPICKYNVVHTMHALMYIFMYNVHKIIHTHIQTNIYICNLHKYVCIMFLILIFLLPGVSLLRYNKGEYVYYQYTSIVTYNVCMYLHYNIVLHFQHMTHLS